MSKTAQATQGAAKAANPLDALDQKVAVARKTFETEIADRLRAEHGKLAEAYGRAVAAFIFDYGAPASGITASDKFRETASKTLKTCGFYVSVSPIYLTAYLIHRGWRLGKTPDQAVKHLRVLVEFSLVVLGEFATASAPSLFSVHRKHYDAVLAAELSAGERGMIEMAILKKN